MTKTEELRNDLDNLHFTCKYLIGVLAELEQMGKIHTSKYKRVENNLNVLKANIKRYEEELEKAEEKEFDQEFPEYYSTCTFW